MNTSKRFSKAAKLLSVFGVIILLSSFLYAFMGVGDGDIFNLIFSFAGPIILVSIGYSIQSIFGAITRYERKDSVFEGNVKYISLSACIIPIVICVLSAIPMTLLYRIYRLRLDKFVDTYDLYLYIPSILAAALLTAGVLLWFFPYHALIRTEFVYGYGALWLVCFIVSGVFRVSLIPVTVLFTLFIGIFFTVSNLGCIEESLSASKFRVPSNNFRSYNLKLTLKHYVVTVIAAILILALMLLVVGSIHPDINLDPKKEAPQEDKVELSDGESEEGIAMDSFWAALFYAKDAERMSVIMKISMIVVVGGFSVFLLWWLYRKHLLKKFFGIVILFFTSISDFIEALLQLFEGRIKVTAAQSYVDTEIELDCVVEYREYKVSRELTRQGFDAELKAKPTLEEKYAYAYSVYTRLIRGHKYGVKASDTPRVLTAKLSAARQTGLEKATPVYEDIRYRVVRPDKTVCEEELIKLTDMVRHIL